MMRHLRPLGGALLAIVLIAAAGVPPADGATGRRVARTGTPRPGSSIILTGSGFPRASIVQVRWDRAPRRLQLIWVDARGRFRASVRIPASASPGTHVLSLGRVSPARVRATGGSRGTALLPATSIVRVTIRVVRPSSPSPSPSPAPTPVASAGPGPGPTPTPTPAPTPTPTGSAPTVPGAPACLIFPAGNVWNRTITGLPVASNSATMIATIGPTLGLHPDFGSIPEYGIPYNVVTSATPFVPVRFDYADESDPGPYPIPASPAMEAGSDHHILIVDAATCRLYETWDSRPDGGGGWLAGSGATWDLASNALRPAGWTSADAAGLPILPGLVRYDEVAAGFIGHAIRFTAPATRAAYIYPARHEASSSTDPALPPMGLRVRLKADYDVASLPPQARVIAQAMKDYGMILADNGSAWYFQGASDARFDDDQLNALKAIPGSAFEAVDTTGFVNTP